MPTVPDAASVLRNRYTLTVLLRVISTIALIGWLVWVAQLLIGHYFFGPPAALVRGGFVPPESIAEPMWIGAVIPAASILISLFAPALGRRLVPMPKSGCPFCGHGGLPETGSNCTECGRTLPAQLLQQARND